MKTYLSLLFIISPLLLIGQINQLTTFKTDNNIKSEVAHKYNGKIYYSYYDDSQSIFVAELALDSLVNIFEVPISTCDINTSCWLMYKSEIIIAKKDQIFGYNFLTGELTFDESINNGNSVDFKIEQDILQSDSINYDLILNTLINKKIEFRGTDYYYFIEGNNIVRQMIEGNTSSEIVVGLPVVYNLRKIREAFYVDSNHNNDNIIYIDKEDNIHLLPQDTSHFFRYAKLINDNILSMVSFSSEHKELFFFDLNSDTLITIIDFNGGQWPVIDNPIVIANNNGKIYYSWFGSVEGNSNQFQFLNYYDIELDSIFEVERLGDAYRYCDIISNDSLVFINGGGNFNYIYNTNLDSNKILPNFPDLNLNYSFQSDNGLYLYYDRHFNKYTFDDNTISNIMNPSNSNKGLKGELLVYQNLIYDTENYNFRVYDPSKDDGIHNIIKNKVSTITYGNSFYFRKDGDNQNESIFCKYNIETNSVEELFILENATQAHLKVINGHIKLPTTSNFGLAVYNVNSEEIITLNSFYYNLNPFRANSKFVRKSQDIYKFNSDIYEDISLIKLNADSRSDFVFNDNQLIYFSNDSLFFNNGVNNYFLEPYENFSRAGMNSINGNFYICKNNSPQNTSLIKIFNQQGELLSENTVTQASTLFYQYEGKYLYYNRNNGIINLTSINLNSNQVLSLELNFYNFNFIGKYNNYYHLFDSQNQKVVVINEDLEIVENYSIGNIDQNLNLTFSNILMNNKVPCLNTTNRYSGLKSSELAYIDLEQKTYNHIIGCEDNLNVNSYQLLDSTIYFKATSQIDGTQLYSYVLENFVSKDYNILSNGLDLLIYPNPVSNELNLSKIVSQLEIYTINGMKILEKGDCSSVDIRNLDDGIYFIRYLYKGKTKSMKFLKIN